MKIIFLTPSLEHPPAGGPYLKTENSIKALSQISELHIISRKPKYLIGGDQAENFYKKYCSVFIYTPSVAPHFLKNWFEKKNWLWKKIYRVKELLYTFSPRKKKMLPGKIAAYLDAKFINDHAMRNNITVIWANYICMETTPLVIKALKKINSSLHIIGDTDSVWSRFLLRGLPFIKDKKRYQEVKKDGEEKIKEEKWWVKTCDVTTAVSKVDLDYYQGLTNTPDKVKQFSNVIDTQTYQTHHNSPENFKTPCMYLAGYFGPNSPMEQAARWIIDDILPLVKKEIPNIHLYLVGKGSDTIFSKIKDPAITVTGLVDSILPYLTNADVALVPLKFESGTRFKILEAGACGIPIVSTTLGAEGLEVEHGKNILIADDPTSFAQAIVKIIKNKEFAQELGNNCKKFVDNNYSIQVLKKEGKIILDYLSLSQDQNYTNKGAK